MTVKNPKLPTSTATYESRYDDDDGVIDLRAYLDILIRWWRLIVLCSVMGAFLAGGLAVWLGNIIPPLYAASASAIMARVTSDVTLDERFQTLSEADVQIDNARRASLVGLVRSGTIAMAVIEELGEILPESLTSPAALLEKIEVQSVPSADSRTPSDLIRIIATAGSPEIAAEIANSWMRHYVAEANALYGQVPIEVYDAVVAEHAQAEADFGAAQERLEDFISRSQIQTLTNQIAEQQELVDFLRQSRADTQIAVLTRDVNLRRTLFERLTAAEIDPALSLLDEQTRQNVRTIADLFAIRTRTQQQLGQAQALRSQIATGGDAAAATNAVALQLLKSQIFAAEPNAPTSVSSLAPTSETEAPPTQPMGPELVNPIQWTINASSAPIAAAEQQRDVAALVDSLQTYLDQLDAAIAESANAVLSGDGYQFLNQISVDQFTTTAAAENQADSADETDPLSTDPLAAAILESYYSLFEVSDLTAANKNDASPYTSGELTNTVTALEQEIQSLSALLEAETARERQLVQQRDLAWNTYDTLSNKIVELNLERTAANREVRAGALATPPINPIPGIQPLMAVVVGGTVGLFFGALLAFLLNYLGKRPFMEQSAT